VLHLQAFLPQLGRCLVFQSPAGPWPTQAGCLYGGCWWVTRLRQSSCETIPAVSLGALPGLPLRRLDSEGHQGRVELAGYVARFLVDKFDGGRSRSLVISESWLARCADSPPRAITTPVPGRHPLRGPPHCPQAPKLLLEAISRLAGEGADVRAFWWETARNGQRWKPDEGLGGLRRESVCGVAGVAQPRCSLPMTKRTVFCLPSYAEGLPLVLVEAWAADCRRRHQRQWHPGDRRA